MGKQRKTWAPELKEQIVLAIYRDGPSPRLRQNSTYIRLARLAGNKQDDGFKSLEKENARPKNLLGEKELALYIAKRTRGL